MYTLFIVGTAGAGKSLLTSSLNEWLRDQEQSTVTVNLDPAVEALPYEPDIDARELVDYDRLMATRGLGPNAALVAAVREIARHIDKLATELVDHNVDYAIVDTPGQLELFAFRREGKIIAEGLAPKPKALLYLLDAILSVTPRNLAASIFLASSIYLRFDLPMLQVLSKSDAVPQKYVSRILRWLESEESFVIGIENRLKGAQMLLSREIARIAFDIGSMFSVIPVSALNFTGLVELHGTLTRMLGEGELELR